MQCIKTRHVEHELSEHALELIPDCLYLDQFQIRSIALRYGVASQRSDFTDCYPSAATLRRNAENAKQFNCYMQFESDLMNKLCFPQ